MTHAGALRTKGYRRRNYLYIVDRKKDMIISGGENVSPAEVENAIYKHPDVAEVAVIGIPDARWGETVRAVVVAKGGTSPTEQDIIDFTRDKLARHKQPRSVLFTDVLPRNAAGKVLKSDLREKSTPAASRTGSTK